MTETPGRTAGTPQEPETHSEITESVIEDMDTVDATPATFDAPTDALTDGPTDAATERSDLRAVIDQSAEPDARDHVAVRVGSLAGLTDRGLRRRRNEDAVALGRHTTVAGDVLVAVVCDGVASARGGDEASLVAVEAAVDAALAAAHASFPAEHSHDETPATAATDPTTDEPGSADEPTSEEVTPDQPSAGTDGPEPAEPDASAEPPAPPAPTIADLDTWGAIAAEAAAQAAAALGGDSSEGTSPACTYVGAVGLRSDAVVSWVGDSRIYWLAEDGSSRLLSVDDSWAEEIAAAGLMPRDQAFTDRRAHVLTRWLGADSPGTPARSRRVRVASPGVLMLCSDGVWNHFADPETLANLVRGREITDAARALVQAALDDGGHDNATVALLPLVPDDDPDTDGFVLDGRAPDERTGPIPLGGDPA